MVSVHIAEAIDTIGREAWNHCFPHELEDFDYLRAIEHSGMQGFAWHYLFATDADGTVLAAMPAFLNDYALDTTLEGSAKKITNALRDIFPNVLTLKLACLGSPDTEYGLIGFHPSVTEEQKPALLQTMLSEFEQFAAAKNHSLIALKDIPEHHQPYWKPVLQQHGYHTVPGLPVAALDLNVTSMDAYMATLSAATRKDMRRKLRTRAELRIEHRTNIDDVLPAVMALYRDTRARADMQFEDLTEQFFIEVLRTMPGRSLCTLYFKDDVLLAANLLLKNETTLLDKFFCMDGARGREHNLYFISWFTNLDYCFAHGLTRYQSGQAAYENKLRLGSRLVRTYMHFKHRNRLMNGALRLAAPLLAPDDIQEAA